MARVVVLGAGMIGLAAGMLLTRDGRHVTYTARRPTLEQTLGRAAERERGLEVRRGRAVAGLLISGANGARHVAGVLLESGEGLRADLVVDAMGRASRLPRWLRAL